MNNFRIYLLLLIQTIRNGGGNMYIGRDMTELTMVSKHEWKEDELAYFHHSLQQILPYLNAEGQSIYKEIVVEIESRGGLQEGEASWTHGTKISYD
ncbi:hypothetical protein CON48_09760 [Bacillus thuringiensis]|uniref:YfhS protein n=1 Tax=Bacillus thuringiensis TaxID=1428 RepID=A0A9X7P840_BACTU|nr:hypothetical protein B4918_02620 [Bacillus thuringiensis]EAO56149.1 hypothetical protein RBTH_05040 [Bacillus thuringiensis serovar israelensis ATCC 35646]MBR9662575.1 hypothetical protein [Bacillus cereus]OTX74177.1 hypothetical protein BK719_10630 [Bacillus thuringiensis serovar novosibirsk]OTY36668.1 hypothetical protein BK736_20355 [Bacillus thuringiensis serovar poloniensis]OTY39057.1 hypothetical protein BK745_15090 [Bacillus thuringiensis serovar alesti]OTZ32707.1 hypothetical prote